MAELFLARARGGAGPYVVLKRILPAQAKRSELVSMFLDEARLSSRLHHPNIARVLDVGRAGHSYFYTMEYVHGRNLREVLERLVELRRFLPLDAALAILVAAAAGLHAAHEQRDRHGRSLEIVHRDVSPSNVMIGFDGAVKIVDFGVAHAVDHVSETRAGVVKGKTGYLSPEQCQQRPLDRRSDVFALGIVAYELVTRTRLFRHASEYETMHAIVHHHPPRPSRVRRELPPALDSIILRALAKDPDERHATAAEVQADLVGLARHLCIDVGPTAVADAMFALFGDCPQPWQELEREHALDTAVVCVSAFESSFIDDEPTDPDADAIDLAMDAMLEPTERTPGPLIPAIASRPPSADDDPDLEVRPTKRRPAASAPPPTGPLAMGTLRPGQRSPLAPPKGGFSVSPTTLTSAAPPPPVSAVSFPFRDACESEPEIVIIQASAAPPPPPPPPPLPLPLQAPDTAPVPRFSPLEPESSPGGHALGILVGAAIGGVAIALVLAIASC